MRLFEKTADPLYALGLICFAMISSGCLAASGDFTVLSDIAYGDHKDQKIDVYLPVGAKNAPVMFMVHGGAWRFGDKSSRTVVKNKVNRWVTRGFIFISINYRLLPEADPLVQFEDVKDALVFSQKKAASWGGSPSKFILMGHSAGAHLVSLLSSTSSPAINKAVKPWLGTVSLDTAAYDIVEIMNLENPPGLYKKAFGNDINYWKLASPYHLLGQEMPPFLAVCSAQRKDNPCLQAKIFTDKAKLYGTNAQLLAVDLSHRGINAELGKSNEYTNMVEEFLRGLDTDIFLMLSE